MTKQTNFLQCYGGFVAFFMNFTQFAQSGCRGAAEEPPPRQGGNPPKIKVWGNFRRFFFVFNRFWCFKSWLESISDGLWSIFVAKTSKISFWKWSRFYFGNVCNYSLGITCRYTIPDRFSAPKSTAVIRLYTTTHLRCPESETFV